MNKMAKSSILIALVIGLIGIYGSASADAAVSGLVLQSTAIDQGYYGAQGLFVPRNQNTALGKPLIVKCPGPRGTCIIEADLFIQSGKSFVTGNQYGLCLFVDGKSAPNCQLVGSTPADNTYTNGSTSQLVFNVKPGNHVVQAYFDTYKGASVFNYTFNYRVYK